MKTGRIFLIGLFICVFLSVSFSVSFSQTTTTKVQNFLKVIQAAKTLVEVGTAFNKAKFSQSEIDQLKKAITYSPTLTQKIKQLYNQEFALMKPRMDQNKQAALANLNTLKSRYTILQQQKEAAAQAALQQAANTTNPCESDTPMIISNTVPIEPGVLFQVLGKGFGKTPGTILLSLGANTYYANIEAWDECYVGARLMSEISGVRATNEATLVLRTGGRETSKRTSFQPTLECIYVYNWGSNGVGDIVREYYPQLQADKEAVSLKPIILPDLGGSADWSVNDFQLRNDWFVISRYFRTPFIGADAHAEITYPSALNSPNDIARTDVHAGWGVFSQVLWELFEYFAGPKGLAYK